MILGLWYWAEHINYLWLSRIIKATEAPAQTGKEKLPQINSRSFTVWVLGCTQHFCLIHRETLVQKERAYCSSTAGTKADLKCMWHASGSALNGKFQCLNVVIKWDQLTRSSCLKVSHALQVMCHLCTTKGGLMPRVLFVWQQFF